MKTGISKVWIFLGVIAAVLCLAACAIIGVVQSTGNNFNVLKQNVARGNSQYSGALNIVTLKAQAANQILDEMLDHESALWTKWADARKGYEEAKASGKMDEQTSAALGLNVALKSIVEANPQIATIPLASQAIDETTAAVNEVFTAFQDQQDAVQAYNTYRGQLIAPAIVGALLNYPSGYDYYEGKIKEPDLGTITGRKTKG